MKKLLGIVITLIFLYSCTEFNPDKVRKPSTEDIKSDLLGKKLGSWTFAKDSEFKNIEIKDSKITYGRNPSEYEMEMNVKLNLSDYITSEYYIGELKIIYTVKKGATSWVYKDMSGEVFREPKGGHNSDGMEHSNNSSADNSRSSNSENSVDRNEELHKKNTEWVTCEWCSKKFQIEAIIDASTGNEYGWEGGVYDCPAARNSNDGGKGTSDEINRLLFNTKPKYCSNRCACTANNN